MFRLHLFVTNLVSNLQKGGLSLPVFTSSVMAHCLLFSEQWRSQNRIVARAQVGHIYNAAQHAKVSVRKHALLGGLGACPPRKILEFGVPLLLEVLHCLPELLVIVRIEDLKKVLLTIT